MLPFDLEISLKQLISPCIIYGCMYGFALPHFGKLSRTPLRRKILRSISLQRLDMAVLHSVSVDVAR